MVAATIVSTDSCGCTPVWLPDTGYRIPLGRQAELAKSAILSALAYTLRAMLRELSERDIRILDFEGSWWLYPGPKDQAIREYLKMSASRYYQALRRLMDDPRARQHSPMTVRRLQRQRSERLAQIASRVRDGDSAG